MTITVKVGNKSSLNMSNINCRINRAITVGELKRLKDESDIIIIEQLDLADKGLIREAIDLDNTIFYIPNNDEVTAGIADELDLDIYLTDKELYSEIKNRTGVLVSPYLEDRRIEAESRASEFSEFDFEATISAGDAELEKEESASQILPNEILDSEYNIDEIGKFEGIVDIKNDGSDDIVDTYENEFDNKFTDDDYNEVEKSDIYEESSLELGRLRRAVDVLKKEKSEIIDRYNRIVDKDNVIENPIPYRQYEELEDKLGKRNEHIDELEDKIKVLNEKVDKKRSQVDEKNKVIDKYRKREQELEEQLSVLTEKVHSGKIHEDVIKKYERELSLTNDKLYEAIKREDDANKKISIMYNELEEITVRAEEEAHEREEKLSNIRRMAMFIKDLEENHKRDISEKDKQIRYRESQIKERDRQYDDLVKTNGNNSKLLLDRARKAEREKETADIEIKDLRSMLKSRDKEIIEARKLAEPPKKLKIDKINYNGDAKIYTVVGNGSYGVTTTAMSIAQKLSSYGRVLFIDFDLVNPMADSWFMITPMIKGITGVKEGKTNSGLGIAYEYGIDMLVKNLELCCRSYQQTKGGGLHYLSGVYYDVKDEKLASLNYSELLNKLGRSFPYIVIDLGKLGKHSLTNNLIKELASIAYRNVVVTQQNYFSIRQFKSRAKDIGLDIGTSKWVINFGNTRGLDDKVKEAIKDYDYVVLNRAVNMGSKDGFLKNMSTRGEFEEYFERHLK